MTTSLDNPWSSIQKCLEDIQGDAADLVQYYDSGYESDATVDGAFAREEFVQNVINHLKRAGKDAWSERPRTFCILAALGQPMKLVESIKLFVEDEIYDFSLPHNDMSLPKPLRTKRRDPNPFLDTQSIFMSNLQDVIENPAMHHHFEESGDEIYTHVKRLGAGNFGRVDEVKIVSASKTTDSMARKVIERGMGYTEAKKLMLHFQKELSALKKLNHRHLVQLLGSYTDMEKVGLLMLPVADRNLDDILEKPSLENGDRDILRNVYGCLTSAIAFLHSKNIRHRDLKPKNVVIYGTNLLVTDFGTAFEWDDGIGSTVKDGNSEQTAEYCAPEQADFKPCNRKSDMWSLGCIFLHVTTVLSEKSRQEMTQFFETKGLRRKYIRLNPPAASEWFTILRSISRDQFGGDLDSPLKWTEDCLRDIRDERPSADTLFSNISQCSGVPFACERCIPREQVDETPIPQLPLESQYLYQSLRLNQIRLLVVLPGQPDEPLLCELIAVDLDSLPQYDAVSWSWGDSSFDTRVFVNGERVRVPRHVQVMLGTLRQQHNPTMLWIDIICLNQEDVRERNHGVARMTDIFHKASQVLIWLGESSEEDEHAFEFAKSLIRPSDVAKLIADPKQAKNWHSLGNLAKRRWFTRRWVFLELAFARVAVALCGKSTITWEDLADAFAIVDSNLHRINRSLRFAGFPVLSGVPILATLSYQIYRRFDGGAFVEKLLTIETLVSVAKSLKVSDPRDGIYSLLPVAKDGEAIKVDYSIPTVEVLQNFVQYCISSSESLDIICRPWMGFEDARILGSDLPSWILSKDRTIDNFVGLPSRKNYNTSYGTKPLSKMVRESSPSQKVYLHVRGVTIGTILNLSGVLTPDSIPLTVFTECGWDFESQSGPESLWRTVVAERDGGGSSVQAWYSRAFRQMLSIAEEVLKLEELISEPDVSEMLRVFAQRMANVITNRKLILIGKDESGERGLVPDDAEPGDIICILFGCSVPVILRPCGSWFQFIGEAFIYGFMDGEIVDRWDEFGVKDYELH